MRWEEAMKEIPFDYILINIMSMLKGRKKLLLL